MMKRRGQQQQRQGTPQLRQKERQRPKLRLISVGVFGFLVLSLFFSLQPHKQSETKSLLEQLKESEISDRRIRETPKDLVGNGDLSVVQLLSEGLPKAAKIHKVASELDTCTHTIVTGYFKVASKFAAENYLDWMKNILSIQDCLVIFTSSEMVDVMRQVRSEHAASKTVLIEMSVDDLPISKLGQTFWQNQLDIDPEKKIHRSYQLFWIWLSKSWCVVQAIQQNFFQSHQIFMWQDIGSFRNKEYNGKQIITHPEIVPPKTILWMAHRPPNPPPDPIWNNKFDKQEKIHYFHSGSQGAGEASAWLEYHTVFAKTMEMYIARNMFVGEDQCVLQSTCQLHPGLCAYVRFDQVRDNKYFGLRYALVKGGTINLWRMPTIRPGA